jgi:D-alanyl-lipoteichoic acid acyltransferase DltB (MBOAT superfamily)
VAIRKASLLHSRSLSTIYSTSPFSLFASASSSSLSLSSFQFLAAVEVVTQLICYVIAQQNKKRETTHNTHNFFCCCLALTKVLLLFKLIHYGTMRAIQQKFKKRMPPNVLSFINSSFHFFTHSQYCRFALL